MNKDKEWLKDKIKDEEYNLKYVYDNYVPYENVLIADDVYDLIDQLDEPEILSLEWIDENKVARINDVRKMTTNVVLPVEKLKNLLVPKQEEVDRAYKDGYEKGKEYTFYKGYLEGLADKESEPEAVADVLADFHKSLERLKKVLGTKVEEIEE